MHVTGCLRRAIPGERILDVDQSRRTPGDRRGGPIRRSRHRVHDASSNRRSGNSRPQLVVAAGFGGRDLDRRRADAATPEFRSRDPHRGARSLRRGEPGRRPRRDPVAKRRRRPPREEDRRSPCRGARDESAGADRRCRDQRSQVGLATATFPRSTLLRSRGDHPVANAGAAHAWSCRVRPTVHPVLRTQNGGLRPERPRRHHSRLQRPLLPARSARGTAARLLAARGGLLGHGSSISCRDFAKRRRGGCVAC